MIYIKHFQFSNFNFNFEQLMLHILDALRTAYFEILMVITITLEMIFQSRNAPFTALKEVGANPLIAG